MIRDLPNLRMVPQWLSDLHAEQAQRERERMRGAEQSLIALRRRLQEVDPSVPRDAYDGNAWVAFERAASSQGDAA